MVLAFDLILIEQIEGDGTSIVICTSAATTIVNIYNLK